MADSEKCSLFSVLERKMRSLEVILHLFCRLFTKVFPHPLSLNKLVVYLGTLAGIHIFIMTGV